MSLALSDEAIKQATLSRFKAVFPDLFTAQLMAQGFTSDEIATISTEKQYVENLKEPEIDVDEELQKKEREAKKKTLELLNKEALAEEKEMAEGYNTQDAADSFKRAEPIFVEPNVTSPVDIQDADYSIVEDQPETYGAIDRVLNWWKINKKRKHAEFVHSSGTLLKVDKSGNITVHAVGNSKVVFEGDVSESISGSKDYIISGKLYEHIVQDVVKQMDSTFTQISNDDTTIIGKNINLNP